ncbi:tryptophan 2,3-dioxygenase [Streptomyces sp. tea 10]|nr:tryptophan 2,3-dioxygenase [Streptomyces sp. tea 10]
MPNTAVEPRIRAEAEVEPLSYGAYLEVPGLLTLQRPRTGAHDEMLFIVTHQAIELWFRCVLHELEEVREALAGERFGHARRGLRRVIRIVSLVLDHVDVLTTMTPAGFNEFRGALGESSGFQSVQFRELEMLSGMRDRRYLNLPGATAAERERLQLRFEEPSLHDVFTQVLRRRGITPEELFGPDLLVDELRDTAEDLLEYDALFHRWRYQHWLLVVRALGTRPGSGGTSGSEFLRSTLDKWFFPELHDARSHVHAAPGEEPATGPQGEAAYGCPMGHGSGLQS